jgi:hypothetical protein
MGETENACTGFLEGSGNWLLPVALRVVSWLLTSL